LYTPLPSSWSLLRLALLQALSGSCILSYQPLPRAGKVGTLATSAGRAGIKLPLPSRSWQK
jgi:hypothetical protein